MIMMDAYSQATFFDLPGDTRPRRIFLAWGDRKVPGKKGKKAIQSNWIWVNAPTRAIAERTATRFLRKIKYRFTHLVEHTWLEYARTFEKIPGCEVDYRL